MILSGDQMNLTFLIPPKDGEVVPHDVTRAAGILEDAGRTITVMPRNRREEEMAAQVYNILRRHQSQFSSRVSFQAVPTSDVEWRWQAFIEKIARVALVRGFKIGLLSGLALATLVAGAAKFFF